MKQGCWITQLSSQKHVVIKVQAAFIPLQFAESQRLQPKWSHPPSRPLMVRNTLREEVLEDVTFVLLLVGEECIAKSRTGRG
jgi:hypothetical protein